MHFNCRLLVTVTLFRYFSLLAESVWVILVAEEKYFCQLHRSEAYSQPLPFEGSRVSSSIEVCFHGKVPLINAQEMLLLHRDL